MDPIKPSAQDGWEDQREGLGKVPRDCKEFAKAVLDVDKGHARHVQRCWEKRRRRMRFDC